MVTPDLGFAHHLYAHHEYYRAIGEYERWLYFNPQDPQVPKVHYLMGRAYQEGDRHQEAILHFNQALSLGPQAKLYLSESLLHTRDASAIGHLSELKASNDSKVGEAAKWLLARYYVGNDQPELARMELPDSAKAIQLKSPSPWIAAGLSTVFPGLGQGYVGHWEDAAFNALTILALGYSSYGSIKANLPIGWAFAGLTGILHAGNIYGAAQAAKADHNTSKKESIEAIDQRWKALCPDPKP